MEDALQRLEFAPIDHILLDNHLPPERDALLRLLPTIGRKEEALKELTDVAAALRAECAAYVKDLSTALAPCRIVPADIWSLIFCLVPESC